MAAGNAEDKGGASEGMIVEDSTTAVLRRAARNVERLFASKAQTLKLTPNLLRVLLLLEANPGMSTVEVARRMDLSKLTNIAIMRNLLERRLIARAADPENRSALRNSLTAKGRQVARRGLLIHREIEGALQKIMGLANLPMKAKLERIAKLDGVENNAA